MNMATATMNPATGGPVGGGMMMMNPNNNGSPAIMNDGDKTPEQITVMLNTYIYEYFLKLRHFEIARTLLKEDKFLIRTIPKSPNHRKDGEMNGIDGDSMDMDQKDDIPDDLPRPAGALSGAQGSGFLFEWFSVFSDLFAAHRNQGKGISGQTPANQYLMQYTNNQRLRENQQNQGLTRPNVMMNPNFMRNGQMRNGVLNGEIAGKRFTPQQMQAMQQKQNQQAMQQQQMSRGDQADGDAAGRPSSPAEGDNGGSPPKRPRLEGGQQQFPPGMMPNGRPGVPGAGQQGMMIQNGFNPNLNQQFRQNGGMPPKNMAANMANGMMQNASSPMMQAMNNFPDGIPMDMYGGNRMPNPAAMQGAQNGQSGNHALQDYQMQLMLLEQQNKKRLMMARQEQHESTNPRDGQPMAGGMQPGMSPSGSKTGTSPNPTEQMRRTPQMGGMPGSPSGDMARQSPAAMNYMNGGIQPEFNTALFMKDGHVMGPGGPAMRPPTSDMNPMNRAQGQQGQQQQGRMQFPGGQPMQQQQSQGQPQPGGKMPPPQAPPAGNNAQRNQAASPANSNPNPPTPSTGNKPNPKKKAANKDAADKKRNAKKGSATNAANSEENPPATPTPSTPITPVNPATFNGSGGKGLAQGAPQPNQQAQQNANMAQNQHSMPDNNVPNTFPDFSTQEPNFNLDFSTLENSDVLENFDFDSFLNTSNDETFSFGDGGMVDNFGMDPAEG